MAIHTSVESGFALDWGQVSLRSRRGPQRASLHVSLVLNLHSVSMNDSDFGQCHPMMYSSLYRDLPLPSQDLIFTSVGKKLQMLCQSPFILEYSFLAAPFAQPCRTMATGVHPACAGHLCCTFAGSF